MYPTSQAFSSSVFPLQIPVEEMQPFLQWQLRHSFPSREYFPASQLLHSPLSEGLNPLHTIPLSATNAPVVDVLHILLLSSSSVVSK